MSCNLFTEKYGTEHIKCGTRKIVSKTAENQCNYRIELKTTQSVCEVELDNGIWYKRKREDGSDASVADYLLLFCDKQVMVLVEFKGGAYSKAITQLLSTISHLEQEKLIGQNWQLHARAVLRSVPNVRPPELVTLQKKLNRYGGTFEKGSNGALVERWLPI